MTPTIDRMNFRSGLERTVASQIISAGLPLRYEDEKIRYLKPAKTALYNPDFWLAKKDGTPMVIEAKGRFLTADRQKHLLIRDQYPDLDLRLVFQNAHAKISKASKTTYAIWCDHKGFKWADKSRIPKEWLEECITSKPRVH